jgi:YaiO family outer membrane protein
MKASVVTVIVAAWLVVPVTVWAQADVIARARGAALDGRRAEALVMLEAHLAQSPDDADGRLVYGLVLSWDGRYEDARRELRRVLAQTPGYADARVALMNVELWSGHREDADALAGEILSRDPGNPQARLVRQRAGTAGHSWTATLSYAIDRFSDDRVPWHEQAVALSRSTPIGAIAFRGTRAVRFSRNDVQLEVEMYPVLRAGTYAFVGFGFASDASLYPRRRAAIDLYQSLGGGVEVSAGYRRLEFTDDTDIYLATLTKYFGHWMASGKVYHVPGQGPIDPTSYHGIVRRYFGADGTSFIGAGYGDGLSREEVRSTGDLVAAFTTVRGQADVAVSSRWRLQLQTSTSRQQQPTRRLWHTTFGGGLSLRF